MLVQGRGSLACPRRMPIINLFHTYLSGLEKQCGKSLWTPKIGQTGLKRAQHSAAIAAARNMFALEIRVRSTARFPRVSRV